MSVLGNAFAGMDQEVLQAGAILILAADRKVAAARTFGSLFALITKHVVYLWFNPIRYYFAADHTYRRPFAAATMPSSPKESLDPSHVLQKKGK
jgi:hypothetical protein